MCMFTSMHVSGALAVVGQVGLATALPIFQQFDILKLLKLVILHFLCVCMYVYFITLYKAFEPIDVPKKPQNICTTLWDGTSSQYLHK